MLALRPLSATFIEIPVEYGLIEAARARSLATGQAPWSPFLDMVEKAWAKRAEYAKSNFEAQWGTIILCGLLALAAVFALRRTGGVPTGRS